MEKFLFFFFFFLKSGKAHLICLGTKNSLRGCTFFCTTAHVNKFCLRGVLQSSRWSEDGAVCVFQLKGHITPVRTLAFSLDGLALASGGVGGLMNIWSLRVTHNTNPTGSPHHVWLNASPLTSLLCPCTTGRLGSPDRGCWLGGDPKQCLDPGCGRSCLLQQVKGKTCHKFFSTIHYFLFFLYLAVSHLHLCSRGSTSRTCWW